MKMKGIGSLSTNLFNFSPKFRLFEMHNFYFVQSIQKDKYFIEKSYIMGSSVTVQDFEVIDLFQKYVEFELTLPYTI